MRQAAISFSMCGPSYYMYTSSPFSLEQLLSDSRALLLLLLLVPAYSQGLDFLTFPGVGFNEWQAPHTIYMFRGVPFRMFAGGQNRLLANPEPWE